MKQATALRSGRWAVLSYARSRKWLLALGGLWVLRDMPINAVQLFLPPMVPLFQDDVEHHLCGARLGHCFNMQWGWGTVK